MAVETMTIAGCRVKIVRIDRPEYDLLHVKSRPKDEPEIKKTKP